MDNKDHQLLVIGVGQMRTGTYSLKLALERLLGGKCYHMIELIRNQQDHIDLWIDAIDKGSLNEEVCKIIFLNYRSTTDYPSAIFYKDLLDIYPNAKMILTTRSTDSWLTSVRNTVMPKPHLNGNCNTHSFLSRKLPRFNEIHKKMISYAFRFSSDLENDETLKREFEIYNEEVRNSIPKERLLEFQIKDGWEPLCKFLKIKEIPSEPFPCVNTTKEFNERFTQIDH